MLKSGSAMIRFFRSTYVHLQRNHIAVNLDTQNLPLQLFAFFSFA